MSAQSLPSFEMSPICAGNDEDDDDDDDEYCSQRVVETVVHD